MHLTPEELRLLKIRAASGDAEAQATLAEYQAAQLTRAFSTRAESLNASARTVDVVASSELPVRMYDWESDNYVDEVLLAGGFTLRGGGASVPVLDTHSRYSDRDIRGAAINWRTEGDKVLATIRFATTDAANDSLTLVKDGALTDVSIGYAVLERTFVPPNTTATIQGKTYTGPTYIVTKWEIRELSLCPIGADINAKIRALLTNTNPHAPTPATRASPGKPANPTPAPPPRPTAGTTPPTHSTGHRTMTLQQLIAALEAARAAGNVDEMNRLTAEINAVRALNAAQAQVIDLEAERKAKEATQKEKDIAEGRRLEAERTDEIRELCTLSGCPASIVEPFIKDRTKTVAEARAAVLTHMTTTQRPAGTAPAAGQVSVGDDNARTHLLNAGPDSICVRGSVATLAGFPGRNKTLTPVAEGTRQLCAFNLVGLARQVLEVHGVRTGTFSDREIIAAVGHDNSARGYSMQGASDFASILHNALNKILQQAYTTAPTVWQDICGIVSLNDTRPHEFHRDAEFKDLPEIEFEGEVPGITLSDGSYETVQAGLFAAIFSLADRVILENDLNTFVNMPAKLGKASALTKEKRFFYALLANPNLRDGNPVFHSSRGNIGTTGVVGVTTMNEAYTIMTTRTALNGEPINVEPYFVLCAQARAESARTFIKTEKIETSGNTQTPNNWQGRLEVRASAYLDLGVTVKNKADSTPATIAGSATKWWTFARPSDLKSIVAGFINGDQLPELLTDRPLEVVGNRYRLAQYHAFGWVDPRGAIYNAGA